MPKAIPPIKQLNASTSIVLKFNAIFIEEYYRDTSLVIHVFLLMLHGSDGCHKVFDSSYIAMGRWLYPHHQFL